MTASRDLNDFDPHDGDSAELLKLRLEGLLALMAIQYAVSFVLMIVPIAMNTESAGWVGIWLALATLAAGYVYQTNRTTSAFILASGLFAAWSLSLWSFPASIAVWFALVVLGEVGTLFGARATFLAGAAVSAVVFAATADGRLTTATAATALALVWLDAVFLWLVARPAILSLEMLWSSYADARESRDQLRVQQGELNRALRSLDIAYEHLENLNVELNRARRVAEEARQLKSEFAASISHELRTPLNLIIGFAEMMLMGPRSRVLGVLPETFRGDIEAIYRNAGHLSSLIDDILDLSQIDAHRMGLRREPVALGPIADEAMLAIDTMFRDKGLGLSAEIPADLPVVNADRVRIRQVLINLLNNAARFTSEGGVTITASCTESDVVVSVKDTGVGVPAEELPTVFDEFRQVGPLGSRHHSGLGLTICKRFVELHGGNIWAESIPGSGSTFRFTLPRTAAVISSPAERDWSALSRRLERDAQPSAVAVLDDDPTIIRLFERYLDGYRVLALGGARAPREPGGERRLRAVISTREPEEDEINRASRLAGGNVPLAFLPLRTLRDTSSDLGVRRYLLKPVSRDQIRAVLAELDRPIRDVLVVDDDPDMVRMLSRMVRAEYRRCRIREARTGRQALAMIDERLPDAVLLDLLMPDVDGYGVIERMAAEERFRQVPVIVITAKGAEDESVVIRSLSISRPGGLTVGEAMGCLRSSLDRLLGRIEERGDRDSQSDPRG